MTFSIVARDRKAGEFGVASATAAPCVGAFLPYAAEGVGAIATQAWVNVNLGYQGLELMRVGLSVKEALSSLLAEDEGRAKRQVIGIDNADVFGFTGDECTDSKGHILDREFAVAGNILSGKQVLEEMVAAFKRSKGDLAHRLVLAVEAGQAAGGDSRGKMSSALLVSSPKPKLFHNLRVDSSDDPVRDLRTLFDRCERMEDELGGDGDGEELRFRVAKVQR